MSLERLIDLVEDHAATCRQLGAPEPGRSVAYAGSADSGFRVSVVVDDQVCARQDGRSLAEAANAARHEFEAWSRLELDEEGEAQVALRDLAILAKRYPRPAPTNVIPLRVRS